MEPIFELGLDSTQWLQASFPQLEAFFRFISQLGLEQFYLAAFPLVYWCIDKRLGKHLAYVSLVSLAVNTIAKSGFRGPRPYWLDAGVGMDDEVSYGVPSGHAQMAGVFYLTLAVWTKDRWVWILSLLMVAAMAVSRVYLGVHFVHDVLVGILLAVLIVVGHYFWRKEFGTPFAKRILGQRVLIAWSVPIIVVAIFAVIRLILGDPNLSVEWAQYIPAAEEIAVEDITMAFGVLLGMGVGIAMERSRLRFVASGPIWKRIVRYILGMAVAVAIWAGLKQIFPEDPLWVMLPLRALRYLLLGVWVAYTGPWLFIKLNLAEQEADLGISMKL